MRELRVLACFFGVMSLLACGDDAASGGSANGGGGSTPEGGAPEGGGGAAAGGGGGMGGGEGGAAPGTPCEEICGFSDSLEDVFMCDYDGSSCIVDCEAGFAATPVDCHDEAIAYNDCLMAQPSGSFTCTDTVDGPVFTLTTGDCDEDYDLLVACVFG